MSSEKLTFEQAIDQLEKVVAELEGGQMPLEKSIKSFEDGMSLVKKCEDQLKKAQGKVEKIVSTASDETKIEDFESKKA